MERPLPIMLRCVCISPRLLLPLLITFSGLVSCRQDSPQDRSGSSGPKAKTAEEAPSQPAQGQVAGATEEPDGEKAYLTHSRAPEALWSGTLTESDIVEIRSQLVRSNLKNWSEGEPEDREVFIPAFLSGFSLDDKPVGGLLSLVSERYGYGAREMSILSQDFMRAVAGLPDSVLSGIAAELDSAGIPSGSTREVLENALYSRYILDAYPRLYKGLEFVRKSFLHFDKADEGGLIGKTHNDTLGTVVSELLGYFNFWIDRIEDGTDSASEGLIYRMAGLLHPESIQPDKLRRRAASLFQEPRPDWSSPPIAVFFDTNAFIDPSVPPDSSSLDVRRKLLRSHIVASALGLGYAPIGIPDGFAEGKEVKDAEYRGMHLAFEGGELSKELFNSGSRYFRKELKYFGLFRDPADTSAYAWEPLVLAPRMTITGYAWDDGIYDIGLQLRVYPDHPRKAPILFAGIPSGPAGKAVPSGGRIAARVSRIVEATRDSGFCRKATETFALPAGLGNFRGLFAVTYYRYQPDSRYYIANLPGQDGDGLVFANPAASGTGPSGEGGEGAAGGRDTSAIDLLQAQSDLYAITSARDTVKLHIDYATGGMGDGETAYSQAARCRFPVVLDANGDRLPDLLVETASGQVLFLQQRDGTLTAAF